MVVHSELTKVGASYLEHLKSLSTKVHNFHPLEIKRLQNIVEKFLSIHILLSKILQVICLS